MDRLSPLDSLFLRLSPVTRSTTRAVDVANTRVVWCDRSATVREAAELMMVHYVRHIFLEEDGRLTGIVAARDHLLGARRHLQQLTRSPAVTSSRSPAEE